jgi:VTC domain
MKAEPSSPLCIEPTPPSLASALWQFAPISLGDMNSVSLMRRIDTKYIIHQDQLPGILNAVENRYAILEIDRSRAMRYASQYFDTAACQFYIDHHNGKAKRTKIRIRRYVDSGIGFLEIKQKSVKGVTSKHRISCAPTETELSLDARAFIDDTTAVSYDLRPTVRNQFRRMTLVDTGRSERVTIDWDLSSHLERIEFRHTNLVVIEVKQEGLDRHAPIMKVLKSVGARPYRVSKYCLGMACLYPHLKSNRFKPRLLRINKITSETRH